MTDKDDFEEIAKEIHSDNSPVGIDAKKTHILIIQMLRRIESRLDAVEKKVTALQALVPKPRKPN